MTAPALPSVLRLAATASGLVLAIAGGLIAASTLVPPVVMLLLPPSIAGTEYAPWLLVLGLVTMGLGWGPATGWPRLRCAIISLSLATILVASGTLLRVPWAITAGEKELRTQFGAGYSAVGGGPLLPTPLSLSTLGLGLPAGTATVTRGVPYAMDGDPAHVCDLYRPAAPGPHPIVVVIHGGAWESGTRSEGATASRVLAGSGFLVMAIDYRLAPAQRFPGQLADVRAALAWIRTNAKTWGGDPSRLALLGRSAGAQLACIAAAAEGPQVQALIGFYSPVDLTIGYRDPGFPDPLDARAVFKTFLGGTPDELPDLYRAASPLVQADRIRVPTLLITGGRDHLVDISFTRQLAARLRTHGTKVAVLIPPWSEHAFDALPNGLGGQLALHHVLRFLRLTLASNTASGVVPP